MMGKRLRQLKKAPARAEGFLGWCIVGGWVFQGCLAGGVVKNGCFAGFWAENGVFGEICAPRRTGGAHFKAI